MSPEQAEGRPADHRGDIYSLGATLYHMLTGRPPFEGTSFHEVLRMQVEEAPVPVGETADWVPERLQAIVARMMAKRPEDRYQTASELVAELEAFLHEARGSGRPRAGRKPLRVRVLVAALLLFIPVTFAAIGYGKRALQYREAYQLLTMGMKRECRGDFPKAAQCYREVIRLGVSDKQTKEAEDSLARVLDKARKAHADLKAPPSE
jgi:hypothetical protein